MILLEDESCKDTPPVSKKNKIECWLNWGKLILPLQNRHEETVLCRAAGTDLLSLSCLGKPERDKKLVS